MQCLQSISSANARPCNSLMDIDDILAEVDGHTKPQETRDLQELTRLWVTERSAPEILPWPDALMERVLERIKQQVHRYN